MVSPMKRVEMICEPLFEVFANAGNLLSPQQPGGTSVFLRGGSAFALIDFSLLK